VENPLNDMTAGAVFTAADYNEYLSCVTTDIEILLYPELGYVAIFTPINFQSYILDKSKLFAPSVVVLLSI